MPWMEEGTPVTMLTLFGFVKDGMHDFAGSWKPLEAKRERFGRMPEAMPADKYAGSKPSTQTTTVGFEGSA